MYQKISSVKLGKLRCLAKSVMSDKLNFAKYQQVGGLGQHIKYCYVYTLKVGYLLIIRLGAKGL